MTSMGDNKITNLECEPGIQLTNKQHNILMKVMDELQQYGFEAKLVLMYQAEPMTMAIMIRVVT